MPARPRLGVFKLASCDGCQLGLLDSMEELLVLAGRVDVAYFPEALRRPLRGRFDVVLVEGSVCTEEQAGELVRLRERSGVLVTLGACATAGGVQALRNFVDGEALLRTVYARPEYVRSLATATPVADHVAVDVEIRGCPPNRAQLLQVLVACLAGRRPRLPDEPVCAECKRAGTPCVAVARGVPCLGPVTHAGCGALCPRHDRGCYGCFGPAADVNVAALAARLRAQGMTAEAVRRLLHGVTGWAPAFRDGGGGAS